MLPSESYLNSNGIMGFRLSHLWSAPVLNPVSKKARSVPVLNPFDRHGRVFFFSWIGFMLTFWAWYAFTPLVGPFGFPDN